ncbi:MAG: M14 family metallopeptidase [Gemmatimonadota bacterium]|nr:M14 family metallopeptidase [Gemmatimonadota bacterium]
MAVTLPRLLSAALIAALSAAAMGCPPSPAIERVNETVGRPALQTRAERSKFTETSRYADVMAFIDSLKVRKAAMWDTSYGVTTEGRAIPFIVLSRPRVMNAEFAHRLGRPIVYVQGNIHAGEVEGKEALLMLMRDLSAQASPGILDSIVLIVVPIYNADGNERFAAQERNRGEQNGPELVGQRPNAMGLDLNRDYVKAEAPETRASLAAFNAWDPDVFVDLHTTDGSYHGYALTYAPSLSPAAPLGDFTRELLRTLRSRMRDRHRTEVFDYGNFDRGFSAIQDSAPKGWHSYEHLPRYGTNYYGLRGRISILSEAYSHDPFERRVRSTYDFVRELLGLVGDRASAIRAERGRVESALTGDLTANRGNSGGEQGGGIALRAALSEPSHSEAILVEQLARVADTTVRSEPGVRRGYRRLGRVTPVVMPVFDRFTPTLRRSYPRGYIIPASDTAALRVLRLHGVQMRVAPSTTLMTEVFDIDSIATSARAFQNHREISLTGRWRSERRAMAAGSYIVDTSQPLGLVAFYLLEPESDDGLVTWNFFDAELKKGGEFPILRVLDALPR